MDDDHVNQTTADEPTQTPPKKDLKAKDQRRKHPFRTLLVVLLVCALVILLVAGWFGAVPGISRLMGATKAQDLGVRYTAADMQSYTNKTGIQFADFASAPPNPNRPGKKLIFGDPKTVDSLSLTQSEITAAVNNLDWKSMPLSNVQVKFGDGTVEVSGNLNTANIASFVHFIGGVGYSDSKVDTAVRWAQRFLNNAPVYVNASISATNDQLSFQLHDAKVGRLAIPQNIASDVLRTGLTNAIVNADNYEIKSASFSPGTFTFSGTYPSTVYVAH